MADVVIGVPREEWVDWLRGVHRDMVIWIGGNRPNVVPGDRVYVAAHGAVRCYAVVQSCPGTDPAEPPVWWNTHVDMTMAGWGVHVGPIMGVTIGEYVNEISEWVERWWSRDAEYQIEDPQPDQESDPRAAPHAADPTGALVARALGAGDAAPDDHVAAGGRGATGSG